MDTYFKPQMFHSNSVLAFPSQRLEPHSWSYLKPHAKGYRKKATKPGQGTANTTVALRAVSENGTGVFRVDMATAVKFKTLYGYSKRHKIRIGADVVVNASGVKVDRKGIRLRSMAPKMGNSCVVLLGALFNFLLFALLDFW
ncbi:hypothetical protein ERO13_A13G141050v2 [Gossypium hirsutum]|uniref:Protein NDR1 n=4 Tax=Gossypium TaxID=3633 RepID=A0A1U8IHU5_GOSHI|nr:protein NDR1-like [Gossypium hirsutum]XP_017618413.1 protein NDR1-like [Gossypium arboreum]KAB2049128.1 hypothetical protein ES319_A13G156500v1 [Gossypium barbadense]TYG86872.1 hypothetical protein ES288_A13G167600v1 [Gossypium darwinii]TYH92262.1 hypothetical protein ES332_A13G170300v1 [Gossypium tomentosum]KAG4166568.1 hypothetical protein ERO13_A13G141050v2 [Gossypium hirsutum]